jgi:hypothetical protein
MRKTSVLALVLCAAWLQAQEGYPSASEKQKSSPELTTIQGCLQSAGGRYTLTESDGTEHRLSGYANKLGKQVGHEVEITGKPGVKTVGTTQQNIASSAIEIPVFYVQTVTHVADACKSPDK